jgi:D-galactarolactone cycloisomerase
MRISDLRVHLVDVEIPPGRRVRSGAGLKLSRQAAFVEVFTDEGVSGIGPCSFGSVSFELTFVKTLVEHVFKPAVIGRDPTATEAIWEELYYGLIVRTYGNRGVGVAILSAIDVALWDLKGRWLGVPVYSLLGGPVREGAPAYASSVYWSNPDECVRTAREYLDRGYSALKIKVGESYRKDAECIEAVCASVGPEVQVMVDANLSYTRDVALKLGRELDRLGVMFFEEPVSLDDVEGYGILAKALDTKIAVGENLYTRWGFLPYLDAGVDVVQPDSSRCGGISEARRVVDLAAARHRLVAPHTFSDAFTLVANLHIALAMSAVVILEVDETYNPLMTELVRNPPAIRQGIIAAPTGPGLGIDLDRDWVEDHPYRGGRGIGPGVRPATGVGDLADRLAADLGT